MKTEKHRTRITKPFLIWTALLCVVAGVPLIFTVFMTGVGFVLVGGAGVLLLCSFVAHRRHAGKDSALSGEDGKLRQPAR